MRTNPRISLNKLAEYTVSGGAHRRRTIVKDQKYPPDFKRARYARARDHAVSSLTQPDPEAYLLAAADELDATSPTGDWDAEDLRLSAESLRALTACLDEIRIDGLTVHQGEHDPPKLDISGVAVSVRPDLVLRGSWRGNPVVGTVKFHFPKGSELGDDGAKNAATVLHQYVEQFLLGSGEAVSLQHCQVVDVFRGVVQGAPKAVKVRRAALAAACDEIALHWSRV